MKDNTVFYVAESTPPDVRDAIAALCAVDPATILLSPTLGYHWDEPSAYDGKTLVQFHRYERGDFTLELEVLLGGRRLSASDDNVSIFRRLAERLQTRVLFTNPQDVLMMADGDAEVRPVTVEFPEEYGVVGPMMRRSP